MNEELRQRMLKAVAKILREGPKNAESGLCNNMLYISGLIHNFKEVREIMEACFREWPKFSGDILFPICGVGGQSPENTYLFLPGKYYWDRDHKYGIARWELTAFMFD